MSRRGTASALGLALALLAGPAAAQTANEEWEERWFNPQPHGSDFLLPLPCGGSMAFQQVRTLASADLMEDQQIVMGKDVDTEDAENPEALTEYFRRSYLLGSLSRQSVREGGRTAFYYIGKYEVSIDQFRAVMQDSCPTPSMAGSLPATDVTWFEAVEFTRRYTEWLLQTEPESLPIEGQYRAFIRLPTEEEWEFAARGGQAVDASTGSLQPLFPMEGPPSDYMWFQGPGSAGGQLHPIGRLEPNPIFLHDILGNAAEMVLEPFRVNRVGRPHGQVGGFVARGGSYLTTAAAMSTAERTEYSYFDEQSGEALRLPYLGFRVAMSAPILVSHERIDRMRADWQNARQFLTGEADEFDPVGALETLRDEMVDPEIRGTLQEIASRFSRELAARSEVEARAVRSAIMSGATLIRMLRNDHRLIDAVARAYEFQANREPDSERTRRLADQLAAHRERAEITFRAYLNILVQAANDYAGELHRQQLALQQQSFEDVGLTTLIAPADLFTTQVLQYQDRQDLDRDALLAQILE